MEMSLEQYIVLISALFLFFEGIVLHPANFKSAVIFKYIPFTLGLALLWTLRDFIIQ